MAESLDWSQIQYVSSEESDGNNDMDEIRKSFGDMIVGGLQLEDNENKDQIVNDLLENGRQSLSKHQDDIISEIYSTVMSDNSSELIQLLKEYFQKQWEIQHGNGNAWFVSFLQQYQQGDNKDIYERVLTCTAEYGNKFMKNCPILSIVLQLLFESIDDECLKETDVFDDLWRSLTTDGLISIRKYFEYIIEDVMNEELNKHQSTLFQALREYYRHDLFLLLKQNKITDKQNLYNWALDSVAEHGWMMGIQAIEKKLTPRSYKMLLEKLQSFLELQKAQESIHLYPKNKDMTSENSQPELSATDSNTTNNQKSGPKEDERVEFTNPQEPPSITSDNSFEDHNTNPSIPAASKGSDSENSKNQGVCDISEKVPRAESSFEEDRNENINDNEQEENVASFIHNNNDTSESESYELLKKKLADGLATHDIDSTQELRQKIKEKNQFIQSLQAERKYNTVQKRKISLAELEKLQLIVDKIAVIESSHLNEDYEVLKKQLESGLAEHDISSEKELTQLIAEKKQVIQSLKTEGKSNSVQKRQKSLDKLEQLQLLVDKIEAKKSQEQLKSSEMNETICTNTSTDDDSLITRKALENMHGDFSSMPSSAERSIIALLFYVSLKSADNEKITLDKSIKIPDQIKTKALEELEHLGHRLSIEEIQSVEIRSILKTVSVHIKDENWKCAVVELKHLFKQLHPLDMHELFRVIEKVNDTAHLIKQKDVILFLGGTGSGKSTTIHFLAGSKMRETKIEGMNHIAPVEIKNSDLNKITTSPFAKSETRYITSVTVNYADVGGYNSGSIILCDSPGFEDTSGPEVDIANGVGIVKAIQGCKSVKPVVLVSYKSIGDRCEGIKDLAHVLVGLIPNIQDEIKTFSYLFTKYPSNEKNTIHASLLDTNRTLSDAEKKNTSFVNILKDMLQKTEDDTRVIDPIKDKPAKLLDELARSAAIHHPEDVFRFFITQKSKAAVQEQVRRHQLSIISAINRFEYEFVKYKLDQLKRLTETLDQDPIKQVYSDCIRQLNKHLSTQYQEGIAAINRCLMNETVLSNEDIEKYQTRINHVKIVEEFSKEHLEMEIISSSAFIQNLNHQGDAMLANLHEKDINDPLVTVKLDKIKLLSTSFSDFDSTKHEQARQLLEEKIDFVVASFKTLVSSNHFDQSANEIAKLHAATGILRGHLKSENMEKKYIELKEYFLEYLNESVTKLSHIFIHKKLEINDIKNLKDCAGMLDNVMNTFALHSYVSKQSISDVYEKFLSEILNRVQVIVQQVETQLSNENSFQELEQHIREFDSIRTIPAITSRTAELYYSTLEKLVGYVREARRTVEEQLKALSYQEGKINYDKLVKKLSSLKSAQWLDNYRQGVYSEVINDIEQQVIEHVEFLKKSVMEINLDLDSSDKIENVSKIVSKVNEMKCTEKIVGDINKHIEEVNSWFRKVTNMTFVFIKDSFNVEKCRVEGYQSLDFEKAEKAFHYLDSCKDIPILSVECTPVLNNLKDVIRDFSCFVAKEMESSFEKIKQCQNKDDKEIFEKAHLLATRLQEISTIKAEYPRIFLCFEKNKTMLVKNWKDQLSGYLTELSNEMQKASTAEQNEILNTKLRIAKALSKLDGFLDHEKYITIYHQYENILFSQTNDVFKRMIDAIKNNDYEQVSSEIATFQTSPGFGEHLLKQAKRPLSVGLDNLMEESKDKAIRLGKDISIDKIQPIVNDLKVLQKAHQFVPEFVGKSDDIKQCIEDVKQLIEDRIKRFLESILALLNTNNFYEADEKIDSITLVCKLLGNNCTADISKQLDELNEYQRKIVLIDVVKKYSTMDLSGYSMSPPTDIFAKFKKVDSTNSIYQQALNAIEEGILRKFREELEKAKKKMPPSCENEHIRKIESAVKYLPEDMKLTLEAELKYGKENIRQSICEIDTKLCDACKSEDLKTIKTVFEEYENCVGMQCYINKGRELVLNQVQEIIGKINQDLERNEIEKALANVKRLHEYKIELESIVSEIKQHCGDVQIRIKKTFEEVYLSCKNRFSSASVTTVSKEIVDITEKNLVCLVRLMKFRYEHKDHKVLADMFPEDFDKKLTELNETITQYFRECEEKYKDALEKLDVPSLKSLLDTGKQWDPLVMKMKSDNNLHSINDPLVTKTVQAISEVTCYPQMLEAVSQKIKEFQDELLKQELINSETKEFEKRRNDFYHQLNEKFSILTKARLLDSNNIGIDVKKIEQEYLESLEIKLTDISSVAEEIMDQLAADSKLTKQDYDRFNLYFSNMISFQQEMKVKNSEVNKKIEKIEKTLFDKIQTWEDLTRNDLTVEAFAKISIDMKRVSNNIPAFKIKINQRIDEVINHYKSVNKDPTVVGKLGAILNHDKNGIGQRIISEHKSFQSYALSLFNEKTQRHGIDYVLQNLEGDFIDKKKLKNRFDEFYQAYRSLIEQYLKPDIALDNFISDTKLIVRNIRQTADRVEWDSTVRSKIPKLAAHVFALWTLKNANHYFEAEGVGNKDSYLLQPHAAQVISIFRMLGIGDKSEELNNNLVEIGTGEGKSVILGVTASILALLGFDVYCACYSEYLSKRDYTAFQSLFDSLSLLDYIHYGTFNKLCEDIINENGNIRQTVEQLIFQGSNTTIQNKQQIKRAKILLIDEVDVFFNRDFYGNVYIPSATLRNPTITSLINFIWTERQRKPKLNLDKVKNTEEYKVCCQQFPYWETLIEEAVKDMLFDVKNFESHHYEVKQDKIGYKEQDDIVFNVVYGYKTLFAYYSEHEKGKITKESLEENIGIRIKCGSFSYAEIPLQFKRITGVTGTLKTLSDPEKGIIQNTYKISKMTIAPSVYGKSNLKFTEKDDIMIEDSHDYFNVIRREIGDRLIGKSSGQRAVLVFFESEQKLMQFYDSKSLESIKESVNYLTEEASAEEKETRIKGATAPGQITLFTRTFGRGTDFICHDQVVLANGGVHVIQTFLSEEASEEKQIRGRTARQGDQGSYSMILLDHDLEKFCIENSQIEDIKKGKGVLLRLASAFHLTKTCDTIYELLNDKRNDLFKTQYEENMQYVEQVKEKHKLAQQFLTSLHSNDMNGVRQFLVEENKGVTETMSSKTICLMDATGSMRNLLHKCKNTVGLVFERAAEILTEHNISSDAFQIQFAVYRNYNSREDKILQTSPWETKPDNLRAFMNTIDVEGGMGNEAIEIGLWHANKEHERENITQVILIGDAPPNTREEVKENRKHFKGNYWKTTKFSQPTYYEDELAKLISNKIPVHAFFVDRRAERSFRKIAAQTGGRCEMLDMNPSSGSPTLTDLVTKEILRNVGGSSKGDALVEAYKNKFGKSYTSN